jgi:hypothetical protein
VKGDFLRFFRDFFHMNTDLSSINTSLIALIPKKVNPEKWMITGPYPCLTTPWNASLSCSPTCYKVRSCS